MNTPNFRRFRQTARMLLSETPARFQPAAFQIELMPLDHKRRINHLTSAIAACATIRQCHKLQRHVSFLCLCHQIGPQLLQDCLSFTRHRNPRIAAVHSFTFSHVVLKRTLNDDFSKTTNSYRTPHCYLDREAVRRIHNVVSPRRSNVTNRNTSLPIK